MSAGLQGLFDSGAAFCGTNFDVDTVVSRKLLKMLILVIPCQRMVMKQIFISGKVQGVSFRYHTYERAERLGIKGWVRNLDDGRVEVVAAAPNEETLSQLVEFLKVGPSKAQVEGFEIRDIKDSKVNFENFSIRRDGGPTWSEFS